MHVSRFILRFVLLVVSHPRLTLAFTLALVGGSVWLALSRLTISTDQNKLFSEKVPFFRNYLQFDQKFPENEAVYVIIEARQAGKEPPVARWTAAADAVAEAMRKLPQYVASVDARVPVHEMGEQGLLFDDPKLVKQTVEDAREMLPMVRWFAEKPGLDAAVFGKTPLDQFLGKLSLAPADPRLAGFVAEAARSLNKTASSDRVVMPDLASLDASDPSRLGYYYVEDETNRSRHLLLVRVYPREDYTSLTANSRKIEAIKKAARDAIAPFGEFKVGVTGRPTLEADEMRTTDRDSTKAEILALSAVFVGMALLLRSIYLAFAAELSLGVGIAWTFAWTTLTVGELNLLSIVFLLALIGIGLDYLVQILSRYRHEARLRDDPKIIWTEVFRQVGPPINTACMGAAGAFLVSLFTDFRGAAELGLIAGGGLLLCLLSGYTFLPALLTIMPMRKGRFTTEGTEEIRENNGKAFFVGPLVWVGLLLVGLIWAVRTGFNPSLLNLQAQKLESVKLVRKLQTWSAVVLSKDLSDLRKTRAVLEGAPTVARTESILQAYDNAQWLAQNAKLPAIAWTVPENVTPNDLGRLSQKASNLAARFDTASPKTPDTQTAAEQLRAFASALKSHPTDAAALRLSQWQRQFQAQLRSLLRTFNPGEPDIANLPIELRSHYISTDGTYALYIHPSHDLWDHTNLNHFVTEIEGRLSGVLSPGMTLTGIAHNIHHSTASIRASFYRATFYALGLIVLLVLIDLRSIPHTLLAISVLALGLPMLVALMGLFHVDWNFANFFGLPILIGAGHEYGVFMVHRYRESLRRPDSPRRHWGRWDVADAALLLCAFITSCSFGFFWFFANHRGLKSLGWVMAVGTACIYLATVIALRPLLKYLLSRGRT